MHQADSERIQLICQAWLTLDSTMLAPSAYAASPLCARIAIIMSSVSRMLVCAPSAMPSSMECMHSASANNTAVANGSCFCARNSCTGKAGISWQSEHTTSACAQQTGVLVRQLQHRMTGSHIPSITVAAGYQSTQLIDACTAAHSRPQPSMSRPTLSCYVQAEALPIRHTKHTDNNCRSKA